MSGATAQQDMWGIAARDWAELIEPTTEPLWKAMLEAAQVVPGTRLLDAGCGAGGASVMAAGMGAQVSGLDASPGMIAVARERLPDRDFRVGDLRSLPFPDSAFDAIIATNSVQFVDDPVVALREIRRVCAPNGRFVMAVWGAPEACDMRDVFKALRETMPSPPEGGGPFALSEPGKLEGLIEQGGLKAVGSGEVDTPFNYPDMETGWRALRSAGVMQAVIQQVGEERLRGALLAAVEKYRQPDGSVRMSNRFRYVVATP